LLLLGDNGEDLVVEVPTGVVLSLDNGKEIGVFTDLSFLAAFDIITSILYFM